MIITVLINILKGFHIIQTIGDKKDGTYLLPHCLFKLPVLTLSLKYIQIGYTSLPFFKKKLYSSGKDESDAKSRPEAHHPAGDPLRKKTTILRRVSQMREATDGVRDGQVGHQGLHLPGS